jgi:hypothetical protein
MSGKRRKCTPKFRKQACNLVRDTLTVLAAAAWWARRRLGIAEPVWTLVGLYTPGRLLAPPG